MIDNRTEKFEFSLSSKEEIEEAYRELCAHYNFGLSKARAYTDSQQGFTASGLLKLCIHFNLKMMIDAMKDEIIIWFHEKEDVPVEVKLDKDTEERIKEINKDIKEDEKEDDPLESVKFSEIKKDPIPDLDSDPLEDLF